MAEQTESKAQVELRFEDMLAIALRWKWVLMFFAFTIPIIAYIFSLLITPVYSAKCVVTVGAQTPASRVMGRRIKTGNNRGYTLTEESLFIKSRMVLNEVVRELQLNVSLTKQERWIDKALALLKGRPSQPVNYRYNVSQLSLTGKAAKGVIIDFINPKSFSVTTLNGNQGLGNGEQGKLFQSERASFLVEDLPAKAQDKYVLQYWPERVIASGLRGGIDVDSISARAFGRTLSMEIEFSHSDKGVAVSVVNEIAIAYLKRNHEESTQNINQILQFVDQQMQIIGKRVEESQANVEDFRKGAGLMFMAQTASSRIGGIRDLEKVKDSNRVQIDMMEKLIQMLEGGAALSDEDIMMVGNAPNPLVHMLVEEINDLELEREVLAKTLKSEHPLMIEKETRIELLKNRVIDSLKSQVAFLNSETDMADTTIDRYSEELESMNEGRRDLSRLQRIGGINRRMLNFLIKEGEETKIARAGVVPDVKIVEPAQFARLIKPIRQRYIVSGILAGLLVGLGMVMFLEYLDNTIKSASWVEKDLGLPVFGMIPNFFRASSRRDRTSPQPGQRDVNLIIQQDPKSHVAEAYRSLRTNIQFANLEDKLSTILITSPGPKEGKSTTIANLAITMANMGSKTLILDCDLRKPIIHRYFGLSRDKGISDILAHNIAWRDSVQQTGIDNCFVITSGKTPPNPSELLGSKRMDQLLKELQEDFDIILIDSSPIIAVTDAVVLSTRVDAIFMVFEIGRTTVDIAMRSVNILGAVNIKPRGAILNNMRPEDRRAYGYGYGYGYGYRYGYKYYKYYRYYNYYNYYYGDDKQQPKSGVQALLDKLSGRKS